MFTIWPLIVWTSVAQPTEQNGHTLGVTFALAMRSSWARATAGVRSTPEAINPPRAVAPPPARERRRTLRREISIANTSLCVVTLVDCIYLYASHVGGRKRDDARSSSRCS